jgi:hypothetical protein
MNNTMGRVTHDVTDHGVTARLWRELAPHGAREVTRAVLVALRNPVEGVLTESAALHEAERGFEGGR